MTDAGPEAPEPQPQQPQSSQSTMIVLQKDTCSSKETYRLKRHTMMKSSFEIAPPDDDDDEHWEGDFHDEVDDESDESDEEAFDGRPVGLSNGNGNDHHASRQTKHHKKGKMKKMKVKTQRDYTSNTLFISKVLCNPRARGACCIGSIACLLMLLLVSWVIPKGSDDEETGQLEEELPMCKVHTTDEPFSEWMHHIRVSNSTDLCRPEVEPSECKCHNPFDSGYETDEWHEVFDTNLKALNETMKKGGNLDLVLYGDSIIERMNGRVFGKPLEEIQDQLAVTEKYFTKEGGGQIEALPLGIAGEQIHMLMYRLENGEMPDELRPGAWWLMIGTNDVIKADCDVDTVVAGIVMVAEEILRRDEINRQFDASHVVINSLFPRLQLDADPLWATVKEINARLECYAETTEGIEFFNATSILLHEDVSERVNSNYFLSDGIHLSASGLRLWEQAIVEKTLYLIEHNS